MNSSLEIYAILSAAHDSLSQATVKTVSIESWLLVLSIAVTVLVGVLFNEKVSFLKRTSGTLNDNSKKIEAYGKKLIATVCVGVLLIIGLNYSNERTYEKMVVQAADELVLAQKVLESAGKDVIAPNSIADKIELLTSAAKVVGDAKDELSTEAFIAKSSEFGIESPAQSVEASKHLLESAFAHESKYQISFMLGLFIAFCAIYAAYARFANPSIGRLGVAKGSLFFGYFVLVAASMVFANPRQEYVAANANEEQLKVIEAVVAVSFPKIEALEIKKLSNSDILSIHNQLSFFGTELETRSLNEKALSTLGSDTLARAKRSEISPITLVLAKEIQAVNSNPSN